MSDLLPPSSTASERAISTATGKISEIPVPIRDVWSPAACHTSIIPWLAWAFSVDEWSNAWTEEQKRDSISQSVSVHRKKGTIGAVIEALNALGLGAKVQEWFNQIPQGAPYTYKLKIDVDQAGLTTQQMSKVLDVVDTTKNLRSHLDDIEITASSSAGIYIGAIAISGNELTYTAPAGALTLNGNWVLDGYEKLNGISRYIGGA